MTKKIPFFGKHIPEVETLDFPALEKAALVQFNEEQQRRILDLTNTYHRNSITWARGPGAGKAQEHLGKVARAANKLAELVDCAILDEKKNFDEKETFERQAVSDLYWPFPDTNPLTFQLTLYQLAGNAKAASRDISSSRSSSRGNPGNPALGTFIRGLHYIWTQAGGKGRGANYNPNTDRPSGPFLRFLQLTLKQAGEDRDLPGLLKAIKSAIPVRKRLKKITSSA